MKRCLKSGLMCLLIAGGCSTGSVYKEKMVAYRPEIGGRSLGVSEAAMTPPGPGGSGSGQSNQQAALNTVSGQQKSTLLKKGDAITIYLYGVQPNPAIQDVIDDNGNVNLPYIGFTNIGGKSSYDAERFIEKAYIEGGYYKQIQVSIVKQFEGTYYVRGEVNNKSGAFQLSGDLTLMQAIACAGGPTIYANIKKVKLIRGGKVFFYNVKKMEAGEEDPPLINPEDVIIVPKSIF